MVKLEKRTMMLESLLRCFCLFPKTKRSQPLLEEFEMECDISLLAFQEKLINNIPKTTNNAYTHEEKPELSICYIHDPINQYRVHLTLYESQFQSGGATSWNDAILNLFEHSNDELKELAKTYMNTSLKKTEH